MPRYSQEIEQVNKLLVSGRVREAQTRVQKLRPRQPPRAVRTQLAALARRASLPDLGVRWLNPIVRTNKRIPQPASSSEKAEYAACLSRIGALSEAEQILNTLDPASDPQVLIFKAFNAISQWDYAKSIPILKTYLRAPGVASYQRLVARSNLLAAYVVERRASEARPLIDQLLEETERKDLTLLYSNILGLAAQQAVAEEDWKSARHYIVKAQARLFDSGAIDEMMLRKWDAIISIGERPDLRSNWRKLQDVRIAATERRHWETVRSCDIYTGLFRQDENLLVHAYAGTPFEPLKREIRTRLAELPSHYYWQLGKSASKRPFDLSSGGIGNARLKPAQALHRTLAMLCRDFYRPSSHTALFALVYPNEYYNPQTSPLRINFVLLRLRRWLAENAPTLHISIRRKQISLVGNGTIRVPLGTRSPNKDAWLWSEALRLFGTKPFSLRALASRLEISDRSTLSKLQAGIVSGFFVRIGRGPTTRYCVRNDHQNT